ncbi:hypothetical protein Tco_0214045 [Tanacetum coccineum]
MVESLFNKFKEDKVRMLLVQDHKGMLKVHGEIHQVKQRLSSDVIVKGKGIWLNDTAFTPVIVQSEFLVLQLAERREVKKRSYEMRAEDERRGKEKVALLDEVSAARQEGLPPDWELDMIAARQKVLSPDWRTIIGLHQVSWNELDLPDFTTNERVYLLAEGKELDEEQLAFLADPGVADGQVAQTITHNAAFQTDDLDAYDFDCDDISSAKAVLMAISQVVIQIFFLSKIVNESLTAELERYKERDKILEQRFNVDLSSREKFIDSQMDDMIRMKNTKFAAFEMEIDTLKQTLSKHNDDVVDICNKCLEFEAEFVKKNNAYNELSKSLATSKGHCHQQTKGNNSFVERNVNPTKVKQDIDEIETINIELEHRKTVIDTIVSKPYAITIALGMFKLELEPLASKVLKNKDSHLDYIKHSREHADILREIVKSARELSPLDSNLESACKYVQRIQEVLVYVKYTCPCLTRPRKKLVVVTPKNKDKKVRFADPVTTSSNTHKQVDSHKPKDSNQPLSHSIGVNGSTGASESKPTSNTKNNRISQSSSSNKNMWKSTGRTFTIDENTCPLTRITSTKVVTLKETTSKSVITQNPKVKVYCRRPKVTKSVGSSSKYKIIESRISNNSESNQSWGSNASDVPSSSSPVDFRLSKLFSDCKDYEALVIFRGELMISWVYYVEGLGIKRLKLIYVVFRRYDVILSYLYPIESVKDQVLVMASKAIPFKLRLHHYTGQTRTGSRATQIKVLEGSLMFHLCSWEKQETLPQTQS